ncbi:hypothetical protein HBI60_053360 [Parastagonospora nodorum]|nr:hypothetical protein HBI47_058550 [Parastagonospora nodorum]KAH6403773.1 hypothetical protein HBI60_053360 [Parastagonospora nodorum]
MVTTFFDLPLELRNMVYHELWECTPRIAIQNEGLNNTVYAHHTSACCDIGKPSRMPLWLLTSKQMLKEAVGEFQLNARWNIALDEEDTFTYEPHILSLLEARYLRVIFFPHAVMFAGDGLPPASGILFPGGACKTLYALVTQLAARQDIRELTFKMYLGSYSESDTPDVDISDLALDVLSGGKLNKFTVIITECCAGSMGPAQKSSCEAKFAKLGEAFMVGPTRFTTEERVGTEEMGTEDRPREIRFTLERC